MKTIWKFPIETTDIQTVRMPIGAKILTVQTQAGQPCLWALVDDVKTPELRYIHVHGTGHPLPDEIIGRVYIGTYQLSGGALVFHVFE